MDKFSMTGTRRPFRLAAAGAMLLMPLANLTLLGRYRDGVLERVPDAPPGALKAGVGAAWLFGSVLNALGVLVLIFLAGVAGAVVCRWAGAPDGFARHRSAVGLAVALFMVGKVLVLAVTSLLFGSPASDRIVDQVGAANPSLLLLAVGCAVAVRRAAELSWQRSALCALAPTAVCAAFCLIPA
ncbi:hypothetical protein IM697_04725 [Streptomyces ferrugineus]|uniref:Yip1 domain-containing protein n=1 Tax=Streptomyces ferrugineus TaxID=1413221 RepID=A0A7M2SMZ1_9ACTN|nr:hypothetical protein [Streptomyces ferrugineus]QOV37730.1 hypothetical protein IM697_04725 [Streptomyces ferrugineus]